MFLWIFSNFFQLNLLLVRSHRAGIIIIKRLKQGRNNVTRVQVEPKPFHQGRRKNDAFTHWATLLTFPRICRFQQQGIQNVSSTTRTSSRISRLPGIGLIHCRELPSKQKGENSVCVTLLLALHSKRVSPTRAINFFLQFKYRFAVENKFSLSLDVRLSAYFTVRTYS